jgi:hypothetical protein
MSVEADFYEAKDVFQATATAIWRWEMADLNRFMYHSVVPRQANQTVEVTRRIVVTGNDIDRPAIRLFVTLGSSNRSSPPGLINFFAARIPPL